MQNRQDGPPKSIKTQLHQRANKIGKVEARITKLKGALDTVQKTWPQHVFTVTQELQAKYKECIDFHARVSQELQALEAEHKTLTTTQLNQPPVIAEPAMQYAAAVRPAPEIHACLNQLLGLLGATVQPNGHANVHTPVPMDTDMQMPVYSQDRSHFYAQHQQNQEREQSSRHMQTSVPTQASQAMYSPPAMNQVHLPVQTTTPDPGQEQSAPGQWGWPPNFPKMPEMNLPWSSLDAEVPVQEPQIQATPTIQAPETSYQQHMQHGSHPGEHQMNGYMNPVPPLDPELLASLQQAAQGLNELPISQGGGGGQGLTDTHIAKLVAFAEQQQQCKQEMHNLQQQMQCQQQQPKHQQQPMQQQQPVQTTAANVDNQIPGMMTPPPVLNSMTTTPARVAQEAMSVRSSPMHPTPHGHSQERIATYSLSPRGQRMPKVAKSRPGHIYDQQRVSPDQCPVPPSDTEEGLPTPVPTEIAEDSTDEALDTLG